MMKDKIKIGSRASRLAVVQVDEVLAALEVRGGRPECERVTFETKGDRDRVTPLNAGTPDDFFTDTLDRALLDGRIDIAVHSAKDLPQAMHRDLEVFALTAALDETDAFVGKVPFDQLPGGACIGTSSDLRQEQTRALRPDFKTRSVRGSIQDRIEQLNQGKYDGLIIAACALKRLGLESLIRDILPWESTPLQGQLAVTGRAGDRRLKELFAFLDVRRTYGRAVLVGAGPGDPGLITVKGVEALKQADTVFYDYLAHPDLLDYAPSARHVYVGKRKGEHSMPQDELCRLLKAELTAGKNIVRLKGGDPLIFGRGADEIAYLRAYHIDVQVIPGLTAATALTSGLGVPLTARGISSSVALISGHGHSGRDCTAVPDRIPEAETLVVYMGLTRTREIMDKMTSQGWAPETPVLVISRGSRFDERVTEGTVATIADRLEARPAEQPALIVAGRTAAFYRPSRTATILYLGTCPDRYRHLGRIIHHPMIHLTDQEEDDSIRSAFSRVGEFDLIVFTSRFAVKSFFRLAGRHPQAAPFLKKKRYAVIGRATVAALECFGPVPDFVPFEETSEGLFAHLERNWDCSGRHILFPRSSLPNPYLRDRLTRAGARVEELTVYRNTKPPRRDLPQEPVDAILFTSPSTVRNFLEDYGSVPANVRVLARGPRTEAALLAEGLEAEKLYGPVQHQKKGSR